MRISALDAATLTASWETHSTDAFKYNATLDLPLHNGQCDAITLVRKTFSAMHDVDASVQFVAHDASTISLQCFLSNKATFDRIFNPFIPRNAPNKMVIGLGIRSTMQFRSLKMAIQPFLDHHHLFLRFTQATLAKVETKRVGYFLFLNPRQVHLPAISLAIATHINQHHKQEHPNSTPLDFPFHLGRTTIKISSPGQTQVSTDAIAIYTHVTKHTHISSLFSKYLTTTNAADYSTPLYVPFSLRWENPTLLATLLTRHNDFLAGHRNVTLVGLSPSILDWKPTNDHTYLWNQLHNLSGFF